MGQAEECIHAWSQYGTNPHLSGRISERDGDHSIVTLFPEVSQCLHCLMAAQQPNMSNLLLQMYNDNGSEGDDESDGQSNDVSESDYEMDGNTSNLDDLEFDHNVYSTVEFGGVQENGNEQVGFVTEPNEVQGEVDQVEEDQVEQGHVEPDPIQIEVHVEPDPVQTEAQVTEPDQVLFEPQEVQVQPPPS
nr:uncharacterized protein LOC109164871 [Ipomoea batatas]